MKSESVSSEQAEYFYPRMFRIVIIRSPHVDKLDLVETTSSMDDLQMFEEH